MLTVLFCSLAGFAFRLQLRFDGAEAIARCGEPLQRFRVLSRLGRHNHLHVLQAPLQRDNLTSRSFWGLRVSDKIVLGGGRLAIVVVDGIAGCTVTGASATRIRFCFPSPSVVALPPGRLERLELGAKGLHLFDVRPGHELGCEVGQLRRLARHQCLCLLASGAQLFCRSIGGSKLLLVASLSHLKLGCDLFVLSVGLLQVASQTNELLADGCSIVGCCCRTVVARRQCRRQGCFRRLGPHSRALSLLHGGFKLHFECGLLRLCLGAHLRNAGLELLDAIATTPIITVAQINEEISAAAAAAASGPRQFELLAELGNLLLHRCHNGAQHLSLLLCLVGLGIERGQMGCLALLSLLGFETRLTLGQQLLLLFLRNLDPRLLLCACIGASAVPGCRCRHNGGVGPAHHTPAAP
eukprot:m.25316 g.25316  ORF g.25316 m.25316 type:complete len:411 (-) comp4226_c0_seq1:54-1286(-)